MAKIRINGQEVNGVEMGDGILSALNAPAPLKNYVTNSNDLENGVQYDEVPPMIDEREVTIPFYIGGSTPEEFEANRKAFYEILYNGSVDLSVPERSDEIFHLKYMNSVEYGQNRNGTFCRLQAKFKEPNPTDRSDNTTTEQ